MKTRDKYIILDRDGVINKDLGTYVKRVEEFIPIKDSLSAISLLCEKNFKIVIVTNQACVEKNLISEYTLKKIHHYMINIIKEAGGNIEYIAYCPHKPETNCKCRKPRTGLLLEIEEKFNISLKNKYFIGDKESDLIAAINHDCKPVLITDGPYSKQAINSPYCPPKKFCFHNLSDAVKFVIMQENKN